MKPVLVFCGPSGAGKSTILKRLFAGHPNEFAFSVSHTTRKPRTGETNGVEYHFVARADFEKMIDDEKFVEFTEFASNLYGTSRDSIERIQNEGKRCVLDVDLQGVKSIKRLDLFAKFIFVNPPSIDVLRTRLLGRGTETDESLAKRLIAAAADMQEQSLYPELADLVVINDDFERAYNQVEDFIFKDNSVVKN